MFYLHKLNFTKLSTLFTLGLSNLNLVKSFPGRYLNDIDYYNTCILECNSTRNITKYSDKSDLFDYIGCLEKCTNNQAAYVSLIFIFTMVIWFILFWTSIKNNEYYRKHHISSNFSNLGNKNLKQPLNKPTKKVYS